MRRTTLYQAVPPALLLLVLILLITVHILPRHSSGLRVRFASDTCASYPYSEGQSNLLHVYTNGGLSIDSELLDGTILASRLSGIYSARPQRVLYLLADNDVPFPWVTDIIGATRHVVKMKTLPGTPALAQELRGALTNTLNIVIRLVRPGAVDASCCKGSTNWAKQDWLVNPYHREVTPEHAEPPYLTNVLYGVQTFVATITAIHRKPPRSVTVSIDEYLFGVKVPDN